MIHQRPINKPNLHPIRDNSTESFVRYSKNSFHVQQSRWITETKQHCQENSDSSTSISPIYVRNVVRDTKSFQNTGDIFFSKRKDASNCSSSKSSKGFLSGSLSLSVPCKLDRRLESVQQGDTDTVEGSLLKLPPY